MTESELSDITLAERRGAASIDPGSVRGLVLAPDVGFE